MVQIIQFPTDEKIPDEIFKPKEKYGLLVIGKGIYSYAANVPDPPRCGIHVSGNLNIYDWELLMTGRLDFGEFSPLNRTDEIIGTTQDENGVTRIVRADEWVRLGLRDLVEKYESGQHPNAGYKEVVKVWPGTNEVRRELQAGIDLFAELSNDKSLTSVVIFSHGLEGRIQMGDSWIHYTDLLEQFDKIRGKKTAFIYGCYSGSFLKALRIHDNRRDYAAIVSCEKDNKSTNWNDRALDNYLFEHFNLGGKFSDLELKPIDRSPHEQHPQMLRYFDCSLM